MKTQNRIKTSKLTFMNPLYMDKVLSSGTLTFQSDHFLEEIEKITALPSRQRF